ncbi:glycosyltransferase family 4 protein [Acidithiobacillus ferrooxidans]|uniref:glycosyltransferase family 4 protein n=1 Tax=Acidithiobacillus ferrooxidans TaxID=920 RepID=UPI0021484637|nr:glycosyltransferase family 1 protein [Acidithiobacillus ferrooxidans]MCR1347135.1 glycosyltransferase family 4 protein [Acidithiobacillus ferrooxidans]MCR1356675.1 glycosyltransferase family 4 protein [Acidithiobacillus ferrooxidans]
MKLLIDMQGAQTPFSKNRGVGRYTKFLASAIAAKNKSFELYLAYNSAFSRYPDFRDLVLDKSQNITAHCLWNQFFETSHSLVGNGPEQRSGEIIREYFLNSFNPDIIFVPNLQEGLFDPAVTSVGLVPTTASTVVTLHDVIPLIYKERYLSDQSITKWYKQKIAYTKKADFIFTVSRSSRSEIAEFLEFDERRIFVVPNAIDHTIFNKKEYSEQTILAIKKRFKIKKDFILYVGGLDEHKNLKTLINAFSLLRPELKSKFQLVFVGEGFTTHGQHLITYAQNQGLQENDLLFTGFVGDEDLVDLYSTCSLFVFPSFHEGFGIPPLEAMACGACVITSNTASLPEIVGIKDAMFDPHNVHEISHKMETSLINQNVRDMLVSNGLVQSSRFSWENSAGLAIQYFTSIYSRRYNEKKSNTNKINAKRVASRLACENLAIDNNILARIAHSVSENFECREYKTIFLDVSAVIINKDRTGIQKVVRAIVSNLQQIVIPNTEFRAVFSKGKCKFFIARGFVESLGDNAEIRLGDRPVNFQRGDILIYLDLNPGLAISCSEHTAYLISKGVNVYHVVYDLLPARYPTYFWPEYVEEFQLWLSVVARSSGALCISKSVMNDFISWIHDHFPERFHLLQINYFYLGSDIGEALPSRGVPDNGRQFLLQLQNRISFLMVGTIEPRKNHDQVIKSFSILWEKGIDINLTIVGKQGWGCESIVSELQGHPEKEKRLFWLSDISDEYLEMIYGSCSCLIIASQDEGFGLPLIEAARHKLPIIARDIPVFREVAGDHAFYFKGDEARHLADAVHEWLGLYTQGKNPSSSGILSLSWRQSALQLLAAVLPEQEIGEDIR